MGDGSQRVIAEMLLLYGRVLDFYIGTTSMLYQVPSKGKHNTNTRIDTKSDSMVPPPTFFNEITGFKTSSRSDLLNPVSLDTPTSSIDKPLHTRNSMDTFLSVVSFLVSSSHDSFETFVKENRLLWEAIAESVQNRYQQPTFDPPVAISGELLTPAPHRGRPHRGCGRRRNS